jgi:hypothetical protein
MTANVTASEKAPAGDELGGLGSVRLGCEWWGMVSVAVGAMGGWRGK